MESQKSKYFGAMYSLYKMYATKTSKLLNKDFERATKIYTKRRAGKPFEVAFLDILSHSARSVAIEMFNKYFNNSTFIFLYSRFEADLRNACIEIQRESSSKLGIKDLEGASYIDKSHKFLTKVVGLNLTPYNKDWSAIRDYQAIRNLMTHNAAILPLEKQNDNIGKIILNNSCIEFDDKTNEFHISDIKFLLDFCDTAAEYLDNIAEEYNKIMPKTNPLDNVELSDSSSISES